MANAEARVTLDMRQIDELIKARVVAEVGKHRLMSKLAEVMDIPIHVLADRLTEPGWLESVNSDGALEDERGIWSGFKVDRGPIKYRDLDESDRPEAKLTESEQQANAEQVLAEDDWAAPRQHIQVKVNRYDLTTQTTSTVEGPLKLGAAKEALARALPTVTFVDLDAWSKLACEVVGLAVGMDLSGALSDD